MRDSLDDLESDVGRFSDTKIPATQLQPTQQQQQQQQQFVAAQQQARRATAASPGKHVCPFCGTQRETDSGACVHCSLEDSPTTRAATRSKLGPWYVLQSRNPSAPGMNFATLMVLVRKGRVTARSVVRGPTTGQFWRHAAKVKGVSREFGLCWGCGGNVAKNARACPGCKRLQEPPPNPDVLLEGGPELSGDELVEAMWSDAPVASPTPAAASRPAPAERPASAEPSSPVDRLVARGGVRREVDGANGRSGAGRGGAVAPSPASHPQRASLSRGALDDLPASNLDMAVFHRPRGAATTGVAGKVFKSLFVAILILCSGLVAMASFDPGMRDRLIGWYGKGRAWAAVTIESVRGTGPAPAPQATAGDDEPARAPEPPASPQDAKVKVWELWQVGVDAEKKGEFAAAVKAWDQIKALGVPENELPLGLDGRLAAAKKRAK